LLDFVISASDVVLTYRADQPGNGWVWQELRNHDTVTLSRVFTFERRDLIAEPDEADQDNDFEAFQYRFRFAVRRDGYFHLESKQPFASSNFCLATSFNQAPFGRHSTKSVLETRLQTKASRFRLP
jgi:hypothetical protein